MNMKTAFRIATVVSLATLVTVGLNAQGAKQFGDHLVGKKMVNFKMKGFDGKSYTNASLKGKVVLMDFWASWCGPCKKASPTMERLYKKYAKDGLVVIGANVMESNMESALAYPKEHGYTYTFTKDNDALGKKLGINGIPAFIFIDKSGKVAQVQTGFAPALDVEFEKTVRKLLGK
jgi:thiol-disulfide isomerase/thioredoxin